MRSQIVNPAIDQVWRPSWNVFTNPATTAHAWRLANVAFPATNSLPASLVPRTIKGMTVTTGNKSRTIRRFTAL